jgi:hypothetical protein
MGGTCVGSGDPCDDSNACTDDTCNEGAGDCDNDCNAVSPVDPCCSDAACSPLPVCQAGGIINIGSFWANCGDVGIKIKLCLLNFSDPIGGLQIDLCEEGHDTTNCLICVECELTERTAMFDCVVNELPNGCCRVILFAKHPGGLINPGECDVVTIVYELSDDPDCCDTCITIDGEGIVLSDEYGYDILGVIGTTGEVCPYVCGDVWPEESSPGAGDCGDSIIDIFDILEEVDIALNDDADACQAGPRSDVPTGTPPYCLDPDGTVNILDVMVIIDMVLDRQDCCSYWYAGIIY